MFTGDKSVAEINLYDLGIQIGELHADVRALKASMDQHLRWHERPQNGRNGPIRIVVSGLPWMGGAGVAYGLLSVVIGG